METCSKTRWSATKRSDQAIPYLLIDYQLVYRVVHTAPTAPKEPLTLVDMFNGGLYTTIMGDQDDVIYKICAAPIGDCGRYHAWPDKVTYVRRFPSAERRAKYWKRYVAPKGSDYHGLAYQVVMVDEWSGGWRFVGEPVYSDVPLIGRAINNGVGRIVECG